MQADSLYYQCHMVNIFFIPISYNDKTPYQSFYELAVFVYSVTNKQNCIRYVKRILMMEKWVNFIQEESYISLLFWWNKCSWLFRDDDSFISWTNVNKIVLQVFYCVSYICLMLYMVCIFYSMYSLILTFHFWFNLVYRCLWIR